MNTSNATPRNLDSAAMTIKDYAEKHGIAPQTVLDVFNAGLYAFTLAGAIAPTGDCPTIHQVPEPVPA